jgi:peptide alpha-N-acetyltransferase
MDDIARLAQEIFGGAQAGADKKKMQKQVDKIKQRMIQERELYFRHQQEQAMIQTYAAQQEQLVANRTQKPDALIELESHYTSWHELAPKKWIRFEQFKPEYMETLIKLFSEELPEPYSPFTYEHFLSGWPTLGIILFGLESDKKPDDQTDKGAIVGAIDSCIKFKYPQLFWQGYIAMLAVRKEWRGHKLGQRLVKITVEMMKKKKVSEVVLETPVSNEKALKLYTDMGFAKTKFLIRFYLDGADAYRLKLWFSAPRLE